MRFTTINRYRSQAVKLLLSAVLLLGPLFSARAELTLDQVVSKLEANFAGIKTYSAKFEQEVKSTQFGKNLTTGSGELFYEKPGKMVWHYQAPEEHWYITNGQFFWDYLPSVKQVLEMKLDQALSSNLPKAFLFGMAKLSDQFTVAFDPAQKDAKDGNYRLVLTPKQDEDKIMLGTMSLLVDGKTFLVKEAKLRDSLGNENFLRFTDTKMNPKIDAKMFDFKIPAGVEKIVPPASAESKGAGVNKGQGVKPK